jgi:CheY-like chemotaxis protein
MITCLIVDDHVDGRDGFQEYLEANGIEVVATGTAEDALQIVHGQAFDLMIVDLQLPGIDGWSYIRAVRRAPALRGIPIIAVSACVFPEDRQRAQQAGCTAFMAKPCAPDELLAEVYRLLDGVPTAAA